MKSKKGEGVIGRKRGRLTQGTIGRQQDYYRYAIVNNKGNVKGMRRVIFATFDHCASTDENSSHDQCPEGETSWRSYNKLIAHKKDVPPGIHLEKIHHPIREEI